MVKRFTRLISGADQRKTRLHNEKGDLVPFSRLLRNGPKALYTGIARLAFGSRPERPWISYDAQAILERHLGPASRVLEFGSGMSTVWYARRANSVLSIEDNRNWFDAVRFTLAKHQNVDYRFADTVADYTDVSGSSFDLIMIDGSFRAECAEAARDLLSPGGIIYLDNSDKGLGGLPGDVPMAERILLEYAKSNNCSVTYFTDFAPTQLFVQQGLLIASL